jgi:6,7-dimethyl-8-ribityllumazine synthase
MSQHAERGNLEIFDASDYKIGIVCSEFNSDITGKLLESAREKCATYGIRKENIIVHKVSGCVEIPLLLDVMAKMRSFDALVALGVVMQGETAHFDYVCSLVTDGVLRVTLDHSIPVGFGVITCDTSEQAHARYSFGSHAVEAAVQSAKILKQYKVA